MRRGPGPPGAGRFPLRTSPEPGRPFVLGSAALRVPRGEGTWGKLKAIRAERTGPEERRPGLGSGRARAAQLLDLEAYPAPAFGLGRVACALRFLRGLDLGAVAMGTVERMGMLNDVLCVHHRSSSFLPGVSVSRNVAFKNRPSAPGRSVSTFDGLSGVPSGAVIRTPPGPCSRIATGCLEPPPPIASSPLHQAETVHSSTAATRQSPEVMIGERRRRGVMASPGWPMRRQGPRAEAGGDGSRCPPIR